MSLNISKSINEIKFIDQTSKVQVNTNENAWIQSGIKCWAYVPDDPDVYVKAIIISEPDKEYKKIEVEIEKTNKKSFFTASTL